jgi:hypothetical protein
VDPLVDQTGQPYVFTNDNPLNATDPLGMAGPKFSETLLLEYGKRYKGGIRGGKFPEEAGPDAVLYRAEGNKITSYQVYGSDGLPRYRVDLTGATHGKIETPQIVRYSQYRDSETGKIYVNKGPVEAAPEEFVPSQEFQSALIRGDSFGTIWEGISGNSGDGPYPKSPLGDTGPAGGMDESNP